MSVYGSRTVLGAMNGDMEEDAMEKVLYVLR
jgi:hypothetical protein